MSGWLSRLFDTSAVPQDYTAPANQLGPLARQVMANPVGTETTSPYASQSVGVPSGPFNPIEAMTPNGPMLGTDVDRAHALVTQGITEYAPTLLGMVGDAPGGKPGFTAYHGSPHDFDAFDTSKIGTGEGAQAYGHGLYFADAEDVAKGYRDQLAGKGGIFEWNGQPVPPGKPAFDLVDNLADQDWRLGKIAEQAAKYGPRNAIDTFEPHTRNASDGPAWQAAMDQFKQGAGKSATGHMYEVNVNADPAHFLDWDRPLSEQHPVVQQALNGLEGLHPNMGGDTTGGTIVSNLENYHGHSADAAQALRDAGIPGIRYLDAGSRNAGGWHITPPSNTVSGKWMVKSSDYNSQGMHFDTEAEANAALADKIKGQTYNHVVFDANTIDIIRKYGIAGLLGGTGAVAGTQQPSQ